MESDLDWKLFLSNLLKIKVENIEAIYQIGSRVYGTATKDSDFDLVVVYKTDQTLNEHFEEEKVSIQLYSTEFYKSRINMHSSILSLTLWLPKELIIYENEEMEHFRTKEFVLDIKKMERAMVGESHICISKSRRLFNIDRKKSLKNIVHGIRYLLFGIQIIEKGAIEDYTVANCYLKEINILEKKRWEEYYHVYEPIYNELKERIINLIVEEKKIYSKYEKPRNFKFSTLDFLKERSLRDLTRIYSIDYEYLSKDLISLKSNPRYSNFKTLIPNECNYLVVNSVIKIF